jgi:hypothetical protein
VRVEGMSIAEKLLCCGLRVWLALNIIFAFHCTFTEASCRVFRAKA